MNRRKSWFVKHSIQWIYLRIVLLAMLIPMMISTACVYYLIWQTVAQELAIPELIAQALFPALQRVNQVLLFGLPVICAIILTVAIKLSHRLAGPIFRIEKELDEIIAQGEFRKNIRIRPNDQVQALVKKINQALQTAAGSRRKSS